MRWTRIIKVDAEANTEIEIVPVAADLEAVEKNLQELSIQTKKHWKPIFISNKFLEDYKELDLDDFRLKERKLKRIGA